MIGNNFKVRFCLYRLRANLIANFGHQSRVAQAEAEVAQGEGKVGTTKPSAPANAATKAQPPSKWG